MKLCHPNPGKLLEEEETEYIIPEAAVLKENGEWQLSFFNWSSPTIQLRDDILQADMPKEGADFLKEKKKEVEMLEQAIQYRGKHWNRFCELLSINNYPFLKKG